MAPPISQHLIQDTDHLQVCWKSNRINFDVLLIFLKDEVRKLERDLNTLSYKCSSTSASCQRDRTEDEDLRRETWRVEAEVRDWLARDARAASSVVAIQESGRLLAGMEMQAI